MIEQTLVAYASQGATATLWLLILLSVVSLAVFVERVVRRRLDRTDPVLLTALEGAEEWPPELVARLGAAEGLEARVLSSGQRAAHRGGAAAAEEALAGQLTRARELLSRNLVLLGSIGSNAPFIGLFGTVLGILRAFGDLALDTKGGAETVMAGISEALVSTAVGLAVAIPAVVLYNYLTRRNERIVERLVALGHQIVGAAHARSGGA
jgi:biopolymer transport protein ExbB